MKAHLLLAVLPLVACHAKFKKYASTLGTARSQIVDPGIPYVHLGGVYSGGAGVGGDLVGAVVNTVQIVRSAEQTDRIAKAVDADLVTHALMDSIRDTLGSGPPFAYTDDPTAPLMQISVDSYGLMVPYLGAPGVFTYDLTVDIYTKEGMHIYNNHVECIVDAAADEPIEEVLSIVDNVAKLESMTDAEINDAFVGIGAWCGKQVVIEMRRHAG